MLGPGSLEDVPLIKGLMCRPPSPPPQLSQDQGQNREALSAEEGRADVGLYKLLSTSAPAPSVGQLLRGLRAEGREAVNVGFITGAGQRIS